MLLPFTKMQGLGNDFVVFDAIQYQVDLSPEQVRFIADRHFGVGCDQVLLVEPATGGRADFRYRIFNADGSEVEQCGNGARCFARFVREQGHTTRDEILVETAAGLITLHVQADEQITVAMGVPEFEPQRIPFLAPHQAARYALEAGETALEIGAVSMGNPHAVLTVGDVASAPVAELGPRIESHARFPRRVNVGFMEVVDRDRIRLRVYERGVGETLACGSGACAAAVVGRAQGLLDERVRVDLAGGTLHIRWSGKGKQVMMTGPAQRVFEGEIDLP